MKRSEMIEHIYDEIKYSIGEQPNLYGVATDILDMIEGFGMRPPKAWVKDPGHFPGDDFSYEIEDWEPEDV